MIIQITKNYQEILHAVAYLTWSLWVFCPPEIFLFFFFLFYVVRESKAFFLKHKKLFLCYFISYLKLLVKAGELAVLCENSVSNEKFITVVTGN